MGRHKIEIKKIDEKHSRQICFTKRRKGLFKKANDLARRGFHVAAVVRSAADNTYVYGSPNADSVAERFVCDLPATPVPNQKQVASTSRSMHADGGGDDDDGDKEMFFDCDNNDRMVELLKSDRFWWNKSIENLGVEELIEFTEKLKLFASTVKERAKLLWIEKPLSLSLSAWR